MISAEGIGIHNGTTSLTTGWMSRFDIAVRTRRRIVLHGNILDLVFDEVSGPCPLLEWFRRRLLARGFQRILHYDYIHPPRLLGGEMPAAMRDVDRLPPARLDATLELLAAVLADTSPTTAAASGQPAPLVRTALILSGAEHIIRSPSREAALLQDLGSGTRSEGPRGLVIHLYTRDAAIPQALITADPDTVVLLVPPPSLSQRLTYFKSVDEGARLLQFQEHVTPVIPERLARVTEGYRLRELQQLEELAEMEGTEGSLSSLLSLFRFGRRHDYWVNHDVEEIMKRLREVVLGQNAAMDQVRDGLYRAKQHVDALIDDTGRHPAMVLFFVGGTGVGKTLMARAICEAVTGTGENLKIFDMSEFQREHSDQRLIGSPPGYVGYEEGGQLTNWVQERPHSVVLIDEVEKAHERILDLFLQILDGARLTNGKGVTVDFSETILIFTSNIGAAEGMAAGLDKNDPAAVATHFFAKVEEFFNEDIDRPELFNRLKKGIVAFQFITEEIARQALTRKLHAVAEGVHGRLTTRDVRIVFDTTTPQDRDVVDKLLERANVETYGLREVDSVLMQLIGAGVGRFLDAAPRPGTYHFRWDARHKNIGLVSTSRVGGVL